MADRRTANPGWASRLAVLLALLLLPLAACTTPQPQPVKRIALTFDDIPRTRGAFMSPDERTERLIAGLRRAGVSQAAFFLNPGNLVEEYGQGGERRIAAYAAAGHVLANHSFSHPRLSTTPTAAYIEDIDRAEAWLKGRPNYRPWFRHPFLDEGQEDKAKRRAVHDALRARGLRNGYVTIDGFDWHMEAQTVAAAQAGKAIDMAALRDLYVETMVGASQHFDGVARQVLGRSPAHVLLLHETDLAALFIEDLVAGFRARGWEIVSADEAFADPLAQRFPDAKVGRGSIIHMIADEAGLPVRGYERNHIPLADALFAERVLKERPPASD